MGPLRMDNWYEPSQEQKDSLNNFGYLELQNWKCMNIISLHDKSLLECTLNKSAQRLGGFKI